jgi:hypothetical protein
MCEQEWFISWCTIHMGRVTAMNSELLHSATPVRGWHGYLTIVAFKAALRNAWLRTELRHSFGAERRRRYDYHQSYPSMVSRKIRLVPVHALKAYRSRGTVPLIRNLGTIWRWVNFTPRPLYPQEKTPVPIEQKAGRAPESVWAVLENRKYLAAAGIRTPNSPSRSYCLHRLRNF